MNNITVNFPSYSIGENALKDIGNIVKKHGKKVMIVGGKTAFEKTQDKIISSLKESEIYELDFFWYGGECTKLNMKAICNRVIEKSIDVIIGVGGGKALDTAKGAAEQAGLPVITVPTIAATCAATTPLSIVYTEHGDFEALFHLTKPPVHIFIDSDVIANAPSKYLWAGIGDTMAKYYEVDIATRGKRLSHRSSMAKELSSMCAFPLMKYGEKAIKDNVDGRTSFELEEVILNNIITTGIVSMLVGDENNGAAAHGLFYGFTLLEEIEKFHIHGEVVAYGVLVLLMMDNQQEKFEQLYAFYKMIKLPTCLQDIDVKNDRQYLENVLEKSIHAPDMLKMPYQVTKDMLYDAIQRLEKRSAQN